MQGIPAGRAERNTPMSQSQYQTMPEPQDVFADYNDDPLEDFRKEDGSYQWAYTVDLHKDLFMLEVVFIALGISFLLILGTMLFASGGRGIDLQTAAILLGCFLVIGLIGLGSWWFVSAMYGWTSGMVFRMDEEGIDMRQVKDQAEKTELIAKAAALTGALTHNYGTMAAGLNASADAHSTFKNVTGISGERRRNRITVRSVMFFNMIYVDDDHYDAVFDYLVQHCPNARVKDQ